MAQFDILAKLRADSTEFIKGLKAGEVASTNFASAVGGMGNAVAIGVAASVAVAGIALFKLGESFHEADKIIRVTTGQTGESLKGLEDSMRAVYGKTAASMKDVSGVISDLNVKLGLTGEPLEKLSLQMIRLSRITGTDVKENTEAVTTVFKNFSVSAQDQSAKLDLMFRASQASGVSVAQLAGSMASAGVVLRSVGMDFDKSAAFVGVLAKAGVEAKDVMPALQRSLKAAGQSGKDAATMFRETYDSIRNATDQSQAFAIASDVFGSRAGPKFAALIREGKLGIDEFTNTIVNGTDTIASASKDVSSFGTKFAIIGHQIQLAFEPLAKTTFNAMNDAMKALMPVFSAVIDAGRILVDGFLALPTPLKLVVPAIAAVVLAFKAWAAMEILVSKVTTAIIGAFAQMAAMLGQYVAQMLVAFGVGQDAAIAFGISVEAALGPVMIALAVAFVAFSLWKNSQRDSSEATKKFTDSLDEQTGAWTKNTSAVIENELAQKGVLDKLNEAGITTVAWRAAVTDSDGATRKMAQGLATAEKALGDARFAGGDWISSINEQKRALQDQAGPRAALILSLSQYGLLTEDLVKTLYDEADAYDKKQEQLRAVGIAQLQANGMSRKAAEDNYAEAAANKKAADEIKGKHDAIKAAIDPLFANEKAMMDLRTAQVEYDKVVKDGTKTEDERRSAYDRVIEATGNYADTLSDLQVAYLKGNVTTDLVRERLETLKRLGVDTNSAAFRDLAARVDFAASAMNGTKAPSLVAVAALQEMKDKGLDPSSAAARGLQQAMMDAGQIAYMLNGTVVSVAFDLKSRAFWEDARAIAAWLNTLSPSDSSTMAAQIAQDAIYGQALGWPFRAAGGPVSAGQPYIVGEKGPEVFIPGQSGGIIPNDAFVGAMSGSFAGVGGNTYNINLHVSPTADKAAIGQATVEAITAYERRNGSGWRS